MKLKFNSIQARLLTGFLFLTLLTIGILFVVFYFYQRIDNLQTDEKKVENLLVESILLMTSDERFLRDDVNNTAFFKNKNSEYLLRRDSAFSEIFKQVYKLRKLESKKEILDSYNALVSVLEIYNTTFLKVLDLYRKRGFKDYGIEGDMRHWIHVLEDSADLNFKEEWVLRLRRHEKDYIIRKDPIYIEQHEEFSKKLMKSLANSKKHEAGLAILQLYCDKFEELVDIEGKLGSEQKSGLKRNLMLSKYKTLDQFNTLTRLVRSKSNSIANQAKLYVQGATAFAVIFSFVLSVVMSRRFSRPIQNLSDNINNFLYKDWKADLLLDENIDILELKTLTKSYKKLVKQLKDQFEETKAKSEELDLQNGKLLKLGEEMDHFVRSSSSKLRAPLNSLQGLTELIKLGKLNANDDATITMMEQSFNQIENYLKEINEYIELKKEDLNVESVLIKPILNNIVQDKRIKNSIPLNFNLEVDDALNIEIDKKRFSQIITHIVDNSFQYYDRTINKLNLLISAKKDKDSVIVEIQDDGIGIDKEYHEDVFKMFFRASEFSKGSGLGLYIAKASLKSMGGTIRINSSLGEGTKVIIQLPTSIS